MNRPIASLRSSLTLIGAFAGVLSVGAGGCAGDLDPSLTASGSAGTGSPMGSGGTMGGGGTPCDAPGMVFAGSANCDACHSAAAAGILGAGLDLQSAGVAARLLGQGPQKGSVGTAACMSTTKPYLVPNSNPPDGFLLDKVDMAKSKAACPGGSLMPLGGSMISASDMSCLQSWAAGVISGAVK